MSDIKASNTGIEILSISIVDRICRDLAIDSFPASLHITTENSVRRPIPTTFKTAVNNSVFNSPRI